MLVVVLVKQVPDPDAIAFDRANRIVRDGVALRCNPLDETALAHALAVQHAHGGEVVVATMGPPSARDVLADALARGADRAIHLTDKRFKGADTLATARALAAVVRDEAPDLVLAGRGTTDGATAQLGQQLAALAGLPCLTDVRELTVADGAVLAVRDTEHGDARWTAPLPAVVTVAGGPALPDADGAGDDAIAERTADDLGGEPKDYGTRGSPTFVKAIRPAGERPPAVPDPQPVERPERDLWVVTEGHGGTAAPVTYEGLACARTVAAVLRAQVTAVLLDGGDEGDAAGLAAHGADRVLRVRHDEPDPDHPAVRTAALAAAIEAERPYAVLGGWTPAGRDVLPAVAARLGLGLTGDCTGLEVEAGDTPRLLWVKPAWAGRVEALVVGRTLPALGTLRPGAVPAVVREGAEPVEVELQVAVTVAASARQAHRAEP